MTKAIFWGLCLMYCTLFAISDHVFLQDYPDWVYQGTLLRDILSNNAPNDVSIKHYPVPNSTATVLLAISSWLLGYNMASKALIIAYLAASFWLVLLLCRRHDPGSAVQKAILVIATLFVSSSLWNGYIGYQLGLLFLGLFYAWSTREPERHDHSRWLIPAFSTLLFFTHFVLFTVLCAYVLISSPHQRRWKRLLQLGPSIGLTAAYVLGRILSGGGEAVDPPTEVPGGLVQHLAYKAYTIGKLGPFQSFLLSDGSSNLENSPALYISFVVLSGLFLATILLLTAKQAFRASRTRTFWNSSLLRLCVVLFGGFMLAPPSFLGVVNMGERLLIPAFLVLMIWVRVPTPILRGTVLVAMVFSVYQAAFLMENRSTAACPDRHAPPAEAYANTQQRLFSHRVFERGYYYLALEERERERERERHTSVLSYRNAGARSGSGQVWIVSLPERRGTA